MSQYKTVYFAALFTAVAFLAGCAPMAKRGYVAAAPAADSAMEADVAWWNDDAEIDPTAPDIPEDTSAGIDMTDVDRLIELARQACADGRFAHADSMLREASAFLMYSSRSGSPVGDDERSRFSVRNYVVDIFSIYSELMPQAFSAPEEISQVIFNLHIMESMLDTLKISPQDSAFLSRLRKKRWEHYDVPVVLNDRVIKALLSLMRTRRGGFDRWLYRAGHYLPAMKKMFADAGLPQDLAYLPIIESGFNPGAYSHASAAGIWQFIPSTGKIYGLRQEYWIDERRDPLKSTEAAIKYLRKLYGDFGDWHIALASYNCGEGGMARAIRRADGVRDYWALSLPGETMNYVPLYLASLIIAKNPDVFEFTLQDSDIYDPNIVLVSDAIEMAVIAAGINLPLATLRSMNPHILRCCTPPGMQDVRLYLPKGYADAFNAFYDTLPDTKRLSYEALAALDDKDDAPQAAVRRKTYRVRRGDFPDRIARAHGVTTRDLMKWNRISSPRSLRAGQTLVIYVKDAVPKRPAPPQQPVQTAAAAQPEQEVQAQAAAVTGGQHVESAEPAEFEQETQIAAATTGQSAESTEPAESEQETLIAILTTGQSVPPEPTPVILEEETGAAQEHTGRRVVKRGETLYGIARELGVPVNDLAGINGLDAGRPMIFPGDTLKYTPAPVQAAAGGAAQPAPQNGEKVSYTVKQGDTLWSISQQFGTSVKAVCDENGITAGSVITTGTILTITRGN